jgi:hypothetical protein
MDTGVKIFRNTVTVRIFCILIYMVGGCLLVARLPFGLPERFKVVVVPVYVFLGAFWLADIFLTRIVLGEDRISIVSIMDFKSHSFSRDEIESVTWEKGCNASLKLHTSKWIRLPHVGQKPLGLTNTIRAWLSKT